MTQEIRPILRAMQVGEQASYPISRTSTVRTSAAIIALELDREFKTSTDRQTKQVTVIRIR